MALVEDRSLTVAARSTNATARNPEYDMSSQRITERILKFVQAKDYQPRKVEQLALALGIGRDEHGAFHDACKALMKTGRIVLGSGQAVMLPAIPGKVIGTFRGNRRGFGFVIPDTPNAHGDLYVPSGGTGGAITGDTVAAHVKRRGKRDGKMLYEGRITSIVKRGQSRFVGELARQFTRWFVIPDGNTLHVPIVVADPGAKGGKPGDQVVVEIVQYPDEDTEARGVIVKVLGKRGEPGVELLSIIEQYQLPGEFSAEVLTDARRALDSYDPAKAAADREDLRKLTIITIDPVDAKDFDDAISITKTGDGTVELGVHIADVAHFVREGKPLDREARERSNSVYLPGMVIPMLPEVLSNGLCSLQERQDRLTKSAFITYDRRGKVKKTRLANTLIRSTKRLTYQQADKILSGKPGRTGAKIVALLTEMDKLARLIHKRRLSDGALELDLPEIELVYDEKGAVVDAEPADDSYPHKIIEMFMVEANEAVARTLGDRRIPFLRRTHGEPTDLFSGPPARLLSLLGYELPDEADRFDVQKLLTRVKGKPESFAVNLAVLRTMQRAEYSPAKIGHFALASKDYSHFTSPIRRYPDLTVHRLVDMHVKGELDKKAVKKSVPSLEQLEQLGDLCSTSERQAESAERELKLIHILRLLEKRLGDEFDGIVTGVANVGVFVQIDTYLVEGLLPFSQLIDDWWEIDTSRGAVVGERSGQRITVGDRLKVQISSVMVSLRQFELAPVGPLPGAGKAKSGRTKPGRATAKTPRQKTVKRSKSRKKHRRPATRKKPRRK